jgi:hypothetical protein
MYPSNQPVETARFTSAVAASMLKMNLCCAAMTSSAGRLSASNLLSAFYFSIPQHMSLNLTGCALAGLEICQPDFSRF